jgi:hypothetical protein
MRASDHFYSELDAIARRGETDPHHPERAFMKLASPSSGKSRGRALSLWGRTARFGGSVGGPSWAISLFVLETTTTRQGLGFETGPPSAISSPPKTRLDSRRLIRYGDSFPRRLMGPTNPHEFLLFENRIRIVVIRFRDAGWRSSIQFGSGR